MAKLLDKNMIEQKLKELNSGNVLQWKVIEGQLRKDFIFEDFVSAFGFMTKAAITAQVMDHHPEWSNVYKVTVNLATHSSGGITNLDFQLAEAMEKFS